VTQSRDPLFETFQSVPKYFSFICELYVSSGIAGNAAIIPLHVCARGGTMSALEPKFGPIETWTTVSGMSRRVTYEKLGTGDLKALKLGARTLIDIEHGLTYMRSLPRARIRGPRHKDTPA
jgi:hypothetical protein